MADIRLVAFDMEGCLTTDPTVWELMHRRWRTWETHGRIYWDRYRAGGLTYDEFARLDVDAWRGAPISLLLESAAEVPLMPGCNEVLAELSRRGIAIAIISNGLIHVAERFRPLGVRHVFANDVLTSPDGRIHGIDLRVPYDNKGYILRQLTHEMGLSREQVAAVGDSLSDVAMFREAACGIAFRPSGEAVAAAANYCVQDTDLSPVLELVLSGRIRH